MSTTSDLDKDMEDMTRQIVQAKLREALLQEQAAKALLVEAESKAETARIHLDLTKRIAAQSDPAAIARAMHGGSP